MMSCVYVPLMIFTGNNADQTTLDSDVSNSMLSELQLDVSTLKVCSL